MGLGTENEADRQDQSSLWEVWAEDLMHETVKDYWMLRDRCASSLAHMPLNKDIVISKANLKDII